MKVVILAGGFGTRISEESHLKPKPMIEIGGMPILWHIMRGYSAQGFNDFVICCGYKAYMIKEYFANYYLHSCDVTFDFTGNNAVEIHNSYAEPWRVTLVDTGLDTMTGGRIKRVEAYLGGEPFMLTYGDGVSDVNFQKLLEFHRNHNKLATLTAVGVSQRFGVLDVEEDGEIKAFREKREADAGLINGGFMVLENDIFKYLKSDETILESDALEQVARDDQLMAYTHDGFWQCMDTQRDKRLLEDMWESGNAPWKTW